MGKLDWQTWVGKVYREKAVPLPRINCFLKTTYFGSLRDLFVYVGLQHSVPFTQ